MADASAPEPLPAVGSWRLFDLHQVLSELTVDSGRIGGARWRIEPAGPQRRVEPHLLTGEDVAGCRWSAWRPPRDLPEELATPERLRDQGVALWVVTAGPEHGVAYLLGTDDGMLVPLGALSGDANSAAWWLTQIVHGAVLPYGPGGRSQSRDQPLVRALALARQGAAIPWTRVLGLAGKPDR